MLNYIWLALILLAVLIGGATGKIPGVTEGALDGAKTAVTIVIGLIGIMALWLGVMRLAEKAGLVQALAAALRPILRWLFPEVPANHPAMGSMVLNISANMLGLSNAATPFGLRAMKHLESLNKNPGTATNAMCTFLTINTSSVQLLPITAVAVMASAGSANATAIIGTAFIATLCSTTVGLTAVKAFEKLRMFRVSETPRTNVDNAVPEAIAETPDPTEVEARNLLPMAGIRKATLFLFLAIFALFFVLIAFPEKFGFLAKFGMFEWLQNVPAEELNKHWLVRTVQGISIVAIPFLLSFFPLYAALRGLSVYEEFVEGAKEGFNVAVRIIPFLVTILVAISMFRGAGGIDMITAMLRPLLDLVQFPSELVPMAVMRPLRGSGSLAIFTDIVKQFGPDSLISRMAGTLYGSTETTFYVVTVYFGAVAIRRTRHAIAAGLCADLTGVIATVVICRFMFS